VGRDGEVDEGEFFQEFARPAVSAADDGGGSAYGACYSRGLRVDHAGG
jgi:hypothetical protein